MKKTLIVILVTFLFPIHFAFAALDASRVPVSKPLFPIPEEIDPSFSGNVNSGPENQVNEAERGLLKQAGELDVPETDSIASKDSQVTPEKAARKTTAYWVFLLLALILIVLSFVMVRLFHHEDKKS